MPERNRFHHLVGFIILIPYLIKGLLKFYVSLICVLGLRKYSTTNSSTALTATTAKRGKKKKVNKSVNSLTEIIEGGLGLAFFVPSS